MFSLRSLWGGLQLIHLVFFLRLAEQRPPPTELDGESDGRACGPAHHHTPWLLPSITRDPSGRGVGWGEEGGLPTGSPRCHLFQTMKQMDAE